VVVLVFMIAGWLWVWLFGYTGIVVFCFVGLFFHVVVGGCAVWFVGVSVGLTTCFID